MKTLLTLKRHVFLLALAFLAFACQDETLNELSKNKPGHDLPHETSRGHHHKKHNTYVLVHGAWHPESSWRHVKIHLERSGNIVKTVQLPGLGDDTTPIETVTFQHHVDAVVQAVAAQSKPVILVGHGYGGAVISQAGENIPQKIKKLIYVSGIMPLNGETVADLALADTQSVIAQNLMVEGAGAVMTNENYGKAIYNVALKRDPHTRRKALEMIGLLRPHPVATLFAPLQLGSNYNGLPKVYISCLKDQASTPPAQKSMYNRVPGIKVYHLHSDHGAMLTAPNQLAELLTK